MTPDALEVHRQRILSLIEEIKTYLQTMEEARQPIAPSSALGRLTRMDALSNQGIQQSLLETAQRRLEGFGNALDRIDRGTYGICMRCSGEISPGRLEAVPEAPVCMGCLDKRNRPRASR